MVASPDYRPYVDLTIFDRQPEDLIQMALAQLAVNLPGWDQKVANTEVALIEALALEGAELIYAINRVTGATATGLLTLKGFSPDVGSPATATATFTLTDSLGHTVPAGTRVRLALGGSTPTLDFVTTSDETAVVGANTVVAAIESVINTDAANNTPSGTALAFVAGAPFITGIVLASSIAGGRLPEDGTAFINRASQGLQRSEALVFPDQFKAQALTNPTIFRATAVSNWDGSGTVGAQPGHVTVAVYGPGGLTVSSPVKAQLLAELQAAALVNLTPHVIDPTITTVAVTCTVTRTQMFDAATVQANVGAAVDNYLSTDTWPWGGTVHVGELRAVIDRVTGVDFVNTITLPASDVTLTGGAPLATAGTVTVTVANP